MIDIDAQRHQPARALRRHGQAALYLAVTAACALAGFVLGALALVGVAVTTILVGGVAIWLRDGLLSRAMSMAVPRRPMRALVSATARRSAARLNAATPRTPRRPDEPAPEHQPSQVPDRVNWRDLRWCLVAAPPALVMLVTAPVPGIAPRAADRLARIMVKLAGMGQTGSAHDPVAGSPHVTTSTPERPGHGLVGMSERVAMLGGQLATGQRDGGFDVHVVIPLPTSPQTSTATVDGDDDVRTP